VRFVGYDIETWGSEDGYALQPWRVKEGTAGITLSAAYCQGKRNVETEYHSALMEDLRKLGKPVVTWNGVFDVAFLHASGVDVSGILWVDAINLWKFLVNGQDMPMSWTLKAGAKRFLKDWPKLQEFLAIKEEALPDPSDPYWLERVSLDAEATALIAEAIWPQLTPQQQNIAKIQAVSLPMIAKSWVAGIRLDLAAVKKARPDIIQAMLVQEEKLGLVEPGSGPDKYTPSKVLRSPVQLRKLLYEDYGLTCTRFTDKNAKSTDRAALTYLSDQDDRVQEIMIWRNHNTILSKFINTPIEACAYLGSDVTHSAPRVFATYTGRGSFSSKIGGKKCGISMHQIPRDKAIRSYLLPRNDNEYIIELDASNQEARLMAIKTDDANMKAIFNSDAPDMHSFTGSQIAGIPYDEFIERKLNHDPEVTGSNGYRALGKFVNLAYNYRSSPATARRIARVQYGIDATIQDTTTWKAIFVKAYPGIPRYWKEAPKIARARGFAETLAGRRYKLTRWHDLDWATSSSAINFCIQGSGADMKELGMAVLVTKIPELENRLMYELHDANYFSIPKSYPVSFLQNMNRILDGVDYKTFWGVDIDIPLPWECSVGPDGGHKIDIGYDIDPNTTLEDYYRANK